MKNLFNYLTAIFITASLAGGQTNAANSAKQTGGADTSAGKTAGIIVNKDSNIKLQTLFVDNGITSKKSTILPRAVELNNRGIEFILDKDYGNALELFKQADNLAPRNEQILFNLGTALLNLKRDNEAAEAFAKIIDFSPTNSNAFASLGVALDNAGKTAESFSAFRRALEISPNDPVTLCNYANALHRAGYEAQALAIVRQAIKISSGKFSAAYNIRGMILFNLKRYREAKTDFELAAKLAPESADPLNNLGVVFSREGNKKKAIKYFLAAESLAPDWEDVAYNLVLNFSEIGNRRKSDEYLLKLKSRNPAIAEQLKKALLQKYVLDISKN